MMAPEDDEPLRALGQEVRAQLDARASEWEAVASGERTAEEVAAARAEAGDAPDRIEQAMALFRPLDDDEEAALVDGLLEARREAASSEEVLAAKVITLADRKAVAPGDVPAPGHGSPQRGAFMWVLVAAAAAAVLLAWLLPSDRPAPDDPGRADDAGLVAVAPLPEYRLELRGGLASMRGDTGPEPERTTYGPRSKFTWTMRPMAPVEGEIEARVLVHGAGAPRWLSPTAGRLEVDAGGSVRFSGQIASLGLAPGPWTVVVVVGRPSQLPREPQQALASDAGAGWVAMRDQILVEE